MRLEVCACCSSPTSRSIRCQKNGEGNGNVHSARGRPPASVLVASGRVGSVRRSGPPSVLTLHSHPSASARGNAERLTRRPKPMETCLAVPNGAGSVRALMLVASASPHALEDLASVAISRELVYSAAGRGFGYTHDAERVHAGDRRRGADCGGQSRIRIVHYCSQSGKSERANSLKRWLLRLDSNQQPSG